MTTSRRAALVALWAALLAPGAFAASGHPKLNAYFQPALTDAPYQQKAFARVAKQWKQPAQAPAPGSKAVVQALIGADGKLLSAVVSLGSGSKQWDAAALAAVQKAAPFDRFPAGYKLPTLEAHFHVSYEK
jgi:protein TonB